MSQAIMLQDWTTVSCGTTGTLVVIQNESGWIDTSGYQDACVYLQLGGCSGTTGNTTIDVQTSPTKDEAFFGATAASGAYFARFSVNNTTSNGVQALQITRFATETRQPLAKWTRWQVTFPSGAAVTLSFRVWLTLSQAGY